MTQKKQQGETIKNLLSHNIRLYREIIGYSQEELAEKAGISPPFLGAIERGEKWPSPETLAGIATGLKVNPYDLFKPEHIISRDINRLTEKMLAEIKKTVNQTVKAINVSLQGNPEPEK
ncbi:MAG: helix-turn-helix transcriptional regulator [Spirochaetaceae bacterium]|jgi:transcriptional regulator with XRE-family HTH domain|nr:helix-turn-helix transcriptional regulator [Spirochaetaceae bacterium]